MKHIGNKIKTGFKIGALAIPLFLSSCNINKIVGTYSYKDTLLVGEKTQIKLLRRGNLY